LTLLGCPRLPLQSVIGTTGGPRSTSLSSLVHLTIAEGLWDDLVSLSVTMPQLKTLCIVLLACSDTMGLLAYDICEIPGLFSSAPRALRSPSLEKLHIAYQPVSDYQCDFGTPALNRGVVSADFRCACANGCSISLMDVCALVHSGLELSQPLRELVLSGITDTVDDDPVAAFLAFHALAENVIVHEAVSSEVERLEKMRERRSAAHWVPSDIFDIDAPAAFAFPDTDNDSFGPAPR
ncbi:hypothetical protein EXIGLDRAFT_720807, partial [Exidia glandulosa HHB12029]